MWRRDKPPASKEVSIIVSESNDLPRQDFAPVLPRRRLSYEEKIVGISDRREFPLSIADSAPGSRESSTETLLLSTRQLYSSTVNTLRRSSLAMDSLGHTEIRKQDYRITLRRSSRRSAGNRITSLGLSADQ